MASLSYSGLGGKRSSGLGRFECRAFPVPDALLRGLARKGSRYMLLSCALPRDEELDQAVEGADYQLVKRSGFVASADYAPQQMRKRDLYVFRFREISGMFRQEEIIRFTVTGKGCLWG